MKKLIGFIIVIIYCSIISAQIPQAYTSSQIYQRIKKLKILGSVLYIAAHPDDENTRLLAYLSNEKLYRTAYLSLTRGDGGQNLIGDEQGVELGLIRTQELLAARRIDGAEQFFTRAYDFGFSKNPKEALQKWNKEKILSDVVWIIRKFQPDVIITRFPEDSRAGHGQHSASAILAREAFDAAADTNRFPEQFKYGVQPWQSKRLLWNTYNFGNNNTIDSTQFFIDVGGYNNLLGKSYGEIAAESRSMHKSQGFGVPRSRGIQMEYFNTIKGPKPTLNLLDYTDSLSAKGAKFLEYAIEEIVNHFDINAPSKSIPALVKLYNEINLYDLNIAQLQYKKAEITVLITQCAGLYIEAIAPQQFIVENDTATIAINMINRSIENINVTTGNIDQNKIEINKKLLTNQPLKIAIKVQFSKSFLETQPYWLRIQMDTANYNVENQELIGHPESDPLSIKIFININGVEIPFTTPIQFKLNDPVKGEMNKPVFLTPKHRIYSNNNIVLFKKGETKNVNITVNVNSWEKFKSNNASVLLKSDKLIQSKVDSAFQSSVNSLKTYHIKINNYLNNQNDEADKLYLSFMPNVDSSNKEYKNACRLIEYEHIPNVNYFYRDFVNVLNIDLKTVSKNIGYINGAGDKVAQALEQMGYNITFLNEVDINEENLKRYDAIVTGVRAYNVHQYLRDKNDILVNYIKNGGNLIVQYNTNNNLSQINSKIGPYNFHISQVRITDETAKVNFLMPDHPVFHYPNTITDKDFEGWVQERSIYHADQIDSHFITPISMKDPDDKEEQNGSLLITKYGKGNFIYTGLSLFRELPAAVAGAYRFLANLIELPKEK